MGELTRIYRVSIKPNLRDEFEPLFRTVALASVTDCEGCTSATLGGPSTDSPNEYVLISRWRDLDALIAFAGDDWTKAHIPMGMERFVDQCWLHHYTDF